MGLAALVLFSAPKSLPGLLSKKPARPASPLLAAGELVADKLPNVPPRTKMPALLVRTGFGALAGGTAAAMTGDNVARTALIGASVATAASFVGERLRTAAAKKVPALVAALAEDALAATLACRGAAWANRVAA
jgi:uncharacterized membrane protein